MNSDLWKEVNCRTVYINDHSQEQCERVAIPLPTGCLALTQSPQAYHGYGIFGHYCFHSPGSTGVGGVKDTKCIPTPEQEQENKIEEHRGDLCQDIPGWNE